MKKQLIEILILFFLFLFSYFLIFLFFGHSRDCDARIYWKITFTLGQVIIKVINNDNDNKDNDDNNNDIDNDKSKYDMIIRRVIIKIVIKIIIVFLKKKRIFFSLCYFTGTYGFAQKISAHSVQSFGQL